MVVCGLSAALLMAAVAALPAPLEDALGEAEWALGRLQGSPDGAKVLSRAIARMSAASLLLIEEHKELFQGVLAVKFVVEAFAVAVDWDTLVWFTGQPRWAFRKLALLRRSELMARAALLEGNGADLGTLVESLRRHWPRVDNAPTRVLASLRCQTANASFSRWLATLSPRASTYCRPGLAAFDARRWRAGRRFSLAAPVAGLYPALTPQLGVKPVPPGLAADLELVKAILEAHVKEPGGLFLEFGVHIGTSLNAMARHLQVLGGGRVYGFDSFVGLPEVWVGAGEDGDLPQGHFGLEGLPQVEPNAELVVGFFNETLPRFLEALPQGESSTLRFLHLDADLYSSTREVLAALGPIIRPGCLIVADDLVNFPGFRSSSMQALEEFLAEPSAPHGLEVLAAPWMIHDHPTLQVGGPPLPWDPGFRSDLERAVAFRVL